MNPQYVDMRAGFCFVMFLVLGKKENNEWLVKRPKQSGFILL